MHVLPRRRLRVVLGAALPLLLTVACAGGGEKAARADQPLRLGYFATVTQSTAVYGVAHGDFQQALGATPLKASVFQAGPAAIEALRGGSLDAAFVGPNPAINAFAQTGGRLLRIVAGTTSGGASLVVAPSITDVAGLAGKRIATPQLGNTQDVAAKALFKEKGVDVDVVNQDNSQTLDLFKAGKIDGGWVPEPWASRMVLDGGGRELIDERTLWPAGGFVTAHLVVRQAYLAEHPAQVTALLTGLLAANKAVAGKTPAVEEAVNAGLKALTGKALPPATLTAAFARLTPTVDPLASSLATSAQHAEEVGLLKKVDLKGIYDLRLLNDLLTASGSPAVTDAGLGVSS